MISKNFKFISLVLATLYLLSSCTLTNKSKMANKNEEGPFDAFILIPSGEFIMGSNNEVSDQGNIKYDPLEIPQRKVFVDEFYIGKYEVTNLQFKKFMDDGGYNKSKYWSKEGWEYRKKLDFDKPSYWANGDYHSGTKYPEYPAVGVSWYEASAYAKWAGGRLPKEIEWEKAARGTDGRLWPWGNNFDLTKANTIESKLLGSAPVGSFPNGKSPYGVMDMAGNVAEWIDDLVIPYPSEKNKTPEPMDSERRSLRGSSWGYIANKARTAFRGYQFPHDRWRGKHMGFRIVKDIKASQITNNNYNKFKDTMSFVPQGYFSMGMDGQESDEIPVRKVFLDDYLIDKYEVTNKDFGNFIYDRGYNKKRYWTDEGWTYIKQNKIKAPYNWGEYSEKNLGIDHPGPFNEEYPTVGVSWYEANAYCKWLEKTLPTEAQWEKAARGVDGRKYPWGNIFSSYNSNTTTIKDQFAGMSPVGSFPSGKSPYGVFDLAGNAIEWVNDFYDENYYGNNENLNPTGPTEGKEMVLRDVTCNENYSRITNRNSSDPKTRFRDNGFRCALNINK